MKRLLSLILSILMLTSAVFTVNISAYASEIKSIDFQFEGEYVRGLVIYPLYIWENLGNKLTLHMSDNTDKDYVCSVKDGEKVFLSSDGDVIKTDEISFDEIKEVVVGNNPINIHYSGFTASTSFTCVSNTVSGIKFAFAEGVSLTEGVGLKNGKYDVSSKIYSVGSVLTVSYSNKADETYTCTVDSSGKYFSFVDANGKEFPAKIQGIADEKKLVPGQLNDIQIFATKRAVTTAKLMLNHTSLVLTNNSQPTCTANGYTGDMVCSACGAVFSAGQVIAATGHSVVNDKAVSASYFATGLTAGSHCSTCNAVITPQKVVAKKKLKATRIKKLAKGKKQFKVTLAKVSGVTGYQITYSTSSKFTKKTTKTVTVKGNKNTSKTIKKLKANKKYYVKVRTYKTQKINGKNKKAYSSYSKVKTVKTTK